MRTACVFGDSVAKGVIFDSIKQKYLLLQNSFANLMEARGELRVKNYSRFGCTIGHGKQLLEKHLKDVKDYDYIVLEYGGNDCDYDWAEVAKDPREPHQPKTTIEEFNALYRALISDIQAAGGRPVLLSLPPINAARYFEWISQGLDKEAILAFLGDVEYIYRWHELYNLAVCRTAMECGVPLIDISSAFLRAGHYETLLCADGIHPNEKGHALIAAEIENRLHAARARSAEPKLQLA